MSDLNEIKQRKDAAELKRDRLKLELSELGEKAERNEATAGDVQLSERLLRGYENAEAEVETIAREYREAIAAGVRSGAIGTESGSISEPTRYRGTAATSKRDRIFDVGDVRSESPNGWKARAADALEVIRDDIGDKAGEVLARSSEREFEVGFATVALANPSYQDAFLRWVRNPERGYWQMSEAERRAVENVEKMRADLSTNTGTGGWLIPTAISPSTVLTGDQVASPVHGWANQEVTAQSPFRQPTTPGATGEWKSEGAAAQDGAPAFSKVDIPLYTTSIYAAASYEILQDTDLARRLPGLFAEEQIQHEAYAVVSGSGSGAPLGAVTDAAATTASRVSPTTAGVFTAADAASIFRLYDSLEPRARASKRLGTIGDNSILSLVRQMGSAVSATYSVDFTGKLEALFGAPIAEASSMDGAPATTGSEILLMGDWSKYTIVRHVLGAQLHYIPSVFDQDSGTPTAQAGFHLVSRMGGSPTDVNAFRLLVC